MTTLAEFIYTRLLRPAPVRRVTNAILLSVIPNTVRVGRAIVHLNPSDPVISGALALRVFERRELAFFARNCRQGMTIKANAGTNTQVHVSDCAASDHEETRQLFVNPQNKADNRLYRSEATP